jgi:L-ascorbate metabolism protein UlaG (beta-lactamase superfamily)
VSESDVMEISWYGRSCVRFRGKDAVVVADPYTAVVGPTGRGIAGDIVTFSHPDDAPVPRARGRTTRDGLTVIPTSLEDAFLLDGPGEYEVRHVLITGVKTSRDDRKGTERGRNVAFVYELDGMHVVHLGDIGHTLSEEKLGEIGQVDIACVPVGGALAPAKAAELIAQLDVKIAVPMPVCEDGVCADAIRKFFHEMGAGDPTDPQVKLSISPSGLPDEATTVLLESRGKA